MWLAREGKHAHKTYVIAGTGWDCVARRMYGKDMIPWAQHDHIKSYSHVMDTIANGLDRSPGTVCLYGRRSFTPGSPEHGYCSKIVGYTGAQLFWRGDPPPSEQIEAARLAFDACHYFTHNIWYAALLFLSEDVLMYDGTTDGGCWKEAPVPEEDSIKQCPDPKTAKIFCSMEDLKPRAMPIMAMLGVSLGVLSILGVMFGCFLVSLWQLRDDAWVFGKDSSGNKTSLFWFLGKFPKMNKPPTDRARAARERANTRRRMAALKERERQKRREAAKEERRILKEERAAKKAAKTRAKEEGGETSVGWPH
mmetsp:Transcript_23469/g.74350  ORF Transcript_23469/g.74350 Transcript_23469/m.74350 type:complete len:308 (+) Transcript_23469:2-925(+)